MSLSAAAALMLSAGTPIYTDWWHVSTDSNGEQMWFVDKSTINPRSDGWTNFSVMSVANGSMHTSVKSMRVVGWVRCDSRAFMLQTGSAFGDDGKWQADVTEFPPQHAVAAGSSEERMLAFACGTQSGAKEYPRGTNPIEVADAIYAQNHPRPAQAPSPGPAQSAPAGRHEFWLVTETAQGDYHFIDKASIVRRSDGKLEFVEDSVATSGPDAAQIHLFRTTVGMDCARKIQRNLDSVIYSSSGSVVERVTRAQAATAYAAGQDGFTDERVEPGSTMDYVFKFVCAGQQSDAIAVPQGQTTVSFADARARAPRRQAASPPPRVPPSGNRAHDFWMVSAVSEANLVVFVDKASIARTAAGKQGFAMEMVDTRPEAGAAKRLAMPGIMDCARHTFGEAEGLAYAKDGTVSGRTPADPEAPINPNATVAVNIFDFVCRRDERNAMRVDPSYDHVKYADLVMKFLHDQGVQRAR